MPAARLAEVGAVIFFANAALLVLQLIASRLLAPFLGSDLYTWTSIIGVFLTGIALGNAYGGRIADRYPSPRTLAVLLVLGAIAAAWMALAPEVFRIGDVYKRIPLGPRIPVLTIAMCLPAGFVLSLLTPLAIKLGLPDLSRTGRVAGLIFALSTLGCLLGNYVTGFYLIPAFRINELVFVSAGILVTLAIATFAVMKASPPTEDNGELGASATGAGGAPVTGVPGSPTINPFAFGDIRRAYLIVFLASFCGMTLELVASRMLAPLLGQSLYTWTGVIGVMLAGTALGNLTGGVLADRANSPGGLRQTVALLTGAVLGLCIFGIVLKGLRPLLVAIEFWDDFPFRSPMSLFFVALAAGLAVGGWIYFATRKSTDEVINPRAVLAGTLVFGAAASLLVFIGKAILTRSEAIPNATLPQQILVWTFTLFFFPMFVLGMVSPQVIRLSVPDVTHVGRVAGRVYAWSTAGAIAGTFATGYLLVSAFGTTATILVLALLLSLLSFAVAPVWKHNIMLYLFAIVVGGVTGGAILMLRPARDDETIAEVETNYYKIRVAWDEAQDPDGNPYLLNLYLDRLLHSSVDPKNPTFIHYEHEYIQLEFLRGARARTETPRVLVVGGGGYTFPRFAMEIMPEARMDVVEIDPGVTKVAREHLGLKDYLGLSITHMDGRQFVAERTTPQSYDLIMLDAVNDLSVPSHLMTKEYNDAVKSALDPKGVYLLTIIDEIHHGKLWKAAMATLRQSFQHVTLLTSAELPDESPPENGSAEDVKKWQTDRENWEQTRQVYVIYAADHPLDVHLLRQHNAERLGFTPKAAVGGNAIASFSIPFFTRPVPDRRLEPHLQREPGVVLTDQYAPVDNLMADVFRRRAKE